MNKQELIKKYEHMNHDSFRRVDVSQVLSDLIRLDGPQKVAIPQYVAEWIDYCKMRKISLAHALYRSDESVDKRVFCWVVDSLDNQETFAKAWIFGYEVEKEKRYLVKVKNVLTRQSALNRNKKSGRFIFSNPEENSLYDTKFTRKELEVAGVGEVFNSPLFEVEEVKE